MSCVRAPYSGREGEASRPYDAEKLLIGPPGPQGPAGPTGPQGPQGPSGGVTTGNLTEATSDVLAITNGTGAVVGSGTTVQVKQASGSQDGFLSSTDWTAFNGKQSALTLGNFTEATSDVLSITGGAGSVIGTGLTVQVKKASGAQDGYLSSTDWTAFNGKQAALTVGNFTETGSSVLTIAGGTGAIIGSGLTIQVKQASGTQSGFLSSTDWSNFNSKQAALTNPVTGTGTASQVTLWSGASTVNGSSGLFFNSSQNFLGIGTSGPSRACDIVGTAFHLSFFGTASFVLEDTSGKAAGMLAGGSGAWFQYDSTGVFGIRAAARTALQADTYDTTAGNVVFKTQSDGSAALGGGMNSNNGDFSGSTLYLSATTTGYVGIGTQSPTQKLDINDAGIRVRSSFTPASSSAAGNQGQIAWDANFIYVCTATNTWTRAALSTF